MEERNISEEQQRGGVISVKDVKSDYNTRSKKRIYRE